MIKPFKLFFDYAPLKTLTAVAAGAITGILYAALIPLLMYHINTDFTSQTTEEHYYIDLLISNNLEIQWIFFAFCLLIFLLGLFSEVTLNFIALKVRANLRLSLYEKIAKAEIKNLEKIGSSRLIQALVNDINEILSGAQMIPALLTSGVTLLALFFYLALVDILIFLLILACIVFGVIAYRWPQKVGSSYYEMARNNEDELQEAFHGLVHGVKDFKLNERKKNLFFDAVLIKKEHMLLNLERRGTEIFSFADNLGGLFAFLIIGLLAFFAFDGIVISKEKLLTAIVILLYISSPISQLLNSAPQFSTVNIAWKKFQNLISELNVENISLEKKADIKDWETIELKNVEYNQNHHPNSVEKFCLGPVNIKLCRGEITFLTGGNGSGKSTLAKIISLHYKPTSGSIYFGDSIVSDANIFHFRHKISSIYSDFYLFDRLLNDELLSEIDNNKFNEILEYLDLSHQIEINNGKFNTLKLSDGQRKRLALSVCLFDDREILVFDEWASDQDPEFKNYFYTKILSDLKRKNKFILVISHDDYYFSVADKTFYLQDGSIEKCN